MTSQEQLDADLDAALADDTRWPTVSVVADWDRDGHNTHPVSDLTGWASDLTIDRQAGNSDLPSTVNLVEGPIAASLSLTLAQPFDDTTDPVTGNVTTQPAGQDPAPTFAPYNQSSSLYAKQTIGTPITADLGFDTASGEQVRRRFTGRVTSIKPSASSHEVAIDALDGTDRCRALITQAPVGLDSLLLATYGPYRYAPRYNSQGLVDRTLRANGYFASPPPQPESFISATMHGWQVPEIGAGGIPQQVSVATPSAPHPWTNDGHPFGMLYPAPGAPIPTGTWDADVSLTMSPGQGFGCSFWMRAAAGGVTDILMGARLDGGPLTASTASSSQYAVLVAVIDGAPTILLSTPTDTNVQGTYPGDWRQPREPTWFHVGMHWAFGVRTCALTVAINGRTYHPATVPLNTGGPRLQPWAPTTTMFYQCTVPMTNICWFRSPTPPQTGGWTGAAWESQADIDPGLNELTGIPQLAGEDSLSLLGEIAEAEAAVFGWDVNDRPYFRSRAVVRDRGTPTPITADRDLSELAISISEETIRNSISSAVTPLLVGDYEFVVDAKEVDQFRCGPGATLFTVSLPPDTVAVDPLRVGQLNEPGYLNAWDLYSDRPDYRDVWMYCAVYVDKPTDAVAPNLISTRLFATTGGQLSFAIFNFSGRAIRFQTEDVLQTQTTTNSDGSTTTTVTGVTPGKAAFRIPGRLLKPQATVPQLIEDPGSVDAFGQRGYDLAGGSGGSRWLQYSRATQGVAESILASTAYPQPVLDTVTALHDPRRELYDTVEIVDPSGMGSVVGTLTGITTHHSIGQACEDDLVLRPLAPPGFGVEGRDGVGTTLRFGA